MDTPKKLSRGQAWILSGAAAPMVAFGILGGWGTYTNIQSVFDRSATALGVVAAGEGATLVLAMVMVGLTMLGQPSPKMVRLGLWALPMAASGVGAFVAESTTEKIVFAVTPMAMCVSAEGLGLLARRVVIYTTGIDMEAQSRNAETMRKISYHWGCSKNHPDEKTRNSSEKKAWKLAERVGSGDARLGFSMVGVQRERMTQGSDSALLEMFGLAVPGQPGTVGQDTETVSLDRTPERPKTVRPRTGQKRSARDFFRDKLLEDADLVVRDAYALAQAEFDPEISEANARKAFNRARVDLQLN